MQHVQEPTYYTLNHISYRTRAHEVLGDVVVPDVRSLRALEAGASGRGLAVGGVPSPTACRYYCAKLPQVRAACGRLAERVWCVGLWRGWFAACMPPCGCKRPTSDLIAQWMVVKNTCCELNACVHRFGAHCSPHILLAHCCEPSKVT